MNYILKKKTYDHAVTVGTYDTLGKLVNAAAHAAVIASGPEPVFSVVAVPETNGDRVRCLTDVELAQYLAEMVDCDECRINLRCPDDSFQSVHCADVWLEWLKSPMEVQT